MLFVLRVEYAFTLYSYVDSHHSLDYLYHTHFLQAVKEVRGQLSKEQRRSEAYKEKALEAHQRNIEAKRVLESLRKD